MIGLISIFVFTALIALTGFYIITRKIFPKMSKRKALWLSIALTTLLLIILGVNLLTVPAQGSLPPAP